MVFLLFVSGLALGGPGPDHKIGKWNGPIVGLPTHQLADVPTLGNGYVGVLVSNNALAPDSVDFWVNTNANWGCDATGKAMPPAVCSMVGFGGFSMVPGTAAMFDRDGAEPLFQAEQRIMNATLWTKKQSNQGSAFETLTYMHPEENVVVVNVTYSNAGSDPDEIDVQLITWAYTQGGRDGVAGPAAGNPGVYVASRNASRSSSIPQLTAAGARAVTSSIALRINGATAAVAEPLHQHAGVGRPRPPPPPPSRATTAATFKIKAGCTVSIVAAVADNVVEGNAHNPANEAVAAAVGANPGTVALAASAWWAKFYSKSSVTLPSSPVVEAYWYGSQYIAAAMSASTTVLQNNEGLLPPSGLYGPWVSSDSPSWNGDFTLDYNQEAQYYGVYSSNHGEHAAPYFPPITDWMAAARVMAQQHAAAGNITCPPHALHYSCHLAPWGYQSHDTSTYMHWNGDFASLLFINNWEYTRNVTWAKQYAYPLLDGLNAWWACYLTKVPNPDGNGYTYHDHSVADPDAEHEGQKVPDPQIALAFIKRSMRAQLEMATAIGETPDSKYADILANLAPFNTALVHPPPPHPSPSPPPAPANCSQAGKFNAMANARFHSDYHEGHSESLSCCQAECEADAECAAFTFCPSKSVPGCDSGQSCWKYKAGATHSTGQGFTSGTKASMAMAMATAVGAEASTVWSAYQNATVSESDAFAVYPLWPSEMLATSGTSNAARNVSNATVALARQSVELYSNAGGIGTRPVLIFPAAIRAGGEQSSSSGGGSAGGRTTQEILAWFQNFLKSQTRSFMPTARGGGTENVGAVVAVNDMLVQSYNGACIELFPVWDKSQDASFNALVVKGAVEVSASWLSASQAVSGVSVRALVAGTTVTFVNPWPTKAATAIRASCADGSTPAVALAGEGMFSFAAPVGVVCHLSPV